MKLAQLYLLVSLTFIQITVAEETRSPDDRERLIHELFDAREKLSFGKALINAETNKLQKQIILEAKFLYHVDLEEYDQIIILTNQFKEMLPNFDPKISKVFATKQDWQSVIEYGLALSALNKNDIPLFKKHITEAFWLSPSKAAAFSPHIIDIQTKEALKHLKVDLHAPIFEIKSAQKTSLNTILGKNKAIVLRFWSPWDRQTELHNHETAHLAKQLSNNHIALASIIINSDPDGISDTKQVIEESKPSIASAWLADDNNSTLTKTLRISSLPTYVLLSPEGKILYHGKMSNKEFSLSLKTIAPNIEYFER